MEQQLQNPYASLKIANGILYTVFSKGKTIDLEGALLIDRAYEDITQGSLVPCITDISGVKNINKQARNFFASKDSERLFPKSAIIVKSGISQILASIFLTIDKPRTNYRVFSDYKKAEEWLIEEK